MEKAIIDFNIVDTALYYGATLGQVQYLLERAGSKISTKTISRHVQEEKGMTFTEYREHMHGGAKLKLQQKQFEIAMKGNASLLIWLGKQWLGQSDKQEEKHTGTVNITIDKDDQDL